MLQTEENEEDVSHRLERKIHDLDMELTRLTPNLKAAGQLADIEAKLKLETCVSSHISSRMRAPSNVVVHAVMSTMSVGHVALQ
jgi:hypothetical protein